MKITGEMLIGKSAVRGREKCLELAVGRRGAVVPLPALSLIGGVEQVELLDLGQPLRLEGDDD